MIRRKRNTTRVELIQPAHSASPPQNRAPAAESPFVDFGLAIKLIAGLYLVIQGSLLIYGYSVLIGYYSLYGIDLGELEISKAELLFSGYVQVLNALFGTSTAVSAVILFLVSDLICGLVIFSVTGRAKGKLKLLASTFAGVGVGLLFLAPAWGYIRGLEVATESYNEQTTNAAAKYKSVHKLTIEGGRELEGRIVFATAKVTFLLAVATDEKGDKTHLVYKINNANNRVMRTTTLVAKPADKPS